MRPAFLKVFKPKLAIAASLGFLCIFFLAKNLSAKATLTKNMAAYVWVYNKIHHTNPSANSEYLANIIVGTSRRLLNNDYKTGTCILKVESDFRIDVIGDDGVSSGISQIQLGSAKDSCVFLGLKDCSMHHIRHLISIPKYNILLSFGYLKFLIDRYHNTNKAVEAYNIGVLFIDNGGRNIAYLSKVQACVRQR